MRLAGRQLSVVAGLVVVCLAFSAWHGSPLGAEPGLRSTVYDVLAVQDAAEVVPADRVSGGSPRWPAGAQADFRVNAAGAPESAVAAVVSAFSTWGRTGIDVQVTYGGESGMSGAAADLDNVVSWVETPDERDVFVARTTTYWYADAPDVIIGFDMVFNLDHAFAVGSVDGAWDVETIALHEFGHVLGLGHADPERVLQIMRPRIEAGDVDHTLSLRDVDAVAALYGEEYAPAVRGFFAGGGAGDGGNDGRGFTDGAVDGKREPVAGLFG